MQAYTITASLAALISASASDFPKFDAFHAHCEMTVTYPNTQCAALFNEIDAEVRSWANGDPSNGLMAIYEEQADSYIWTTRTTPVKHYVDDQIFEFSQKGQDCNVQARSRSQINSYYDYDTNYCNMWNVLNSIGGMTNQSVSNCNFRPDDDAVTCAQY